MAQRNAELAKRLEQGLERQSRLRELGDDTGSVDEEILSLKRQLREGGRLPEGDCLGDRYVLRRKLGEGGYATVWRAHDKVARIDVAVKVLHANLADSGANLDRFRRGARIMASLQHPSIVRVLEHDCADAGWHYFVMECLDGGDLSRLESLTPHQALDTIMSIADALIYTHAGGHIHRDIKPANILLTAGGVPKLSDFDLVLADDTTGGTRSGALGTFVYAAPESLSHPQDVDERADVYGLTMTLLYCLYGKQLPYAVVRSPAPLLDEIQAPPSLRHVIERGLSWEVEQRYQDVASFREALSQQRAQILALPSVRSVQPVALPAHPTSVSANSPLTVSEEPETKGQLGSGKAISTLLVVSLATLLTYAFWLYRHGSPAGPKASVKPAAGANTVDTGSASAGASSAAVNPGSGGAAPTTPSKPTCEAVVRNSPGKRNLNTLQSKIVSEHRSDTAKRLWMAAITADGRTHYCGGALFKKDWLLTGAHCEVSLSDKVIVGRSDLNNTGAGAVVAIAEVKTHPKYNADTHEFDISLVHVDGAPELPLLDLYDGDADLDGEQATAFGWGSTHEGETISSKLREVGIPVVSNEACNHGYKPEGIVISGNMLCAGLKTGGKDACHGFGGGPLVIQSGGREVQAGILSFGIGCGRPGLFGVYTRISQFSSWIQACSQ